MHAVAVASGALDQVGASQGVQHPAGFRDTGAGKGRH
jgi:hypothetical protein